MATDKSEAETSAPKSKKKMIIGLGVLGIVILGTLLYIWMHHGEEHTDNAQLEADVVAMAPRVGGYVTHLYVHDNQLVKKGDELLQIEPYEYVVALSRAKASVDAAKAEWDRAQKERERMEKLGNEARSRQDLENAQASEQAAKAQFDLATADWMQAKKDMTDTKLIAPMDGKITERSVEQGALLQPGQRVFSIVSNNLWVVANYKETQLENMRVGQRVEIEVDAYPDVELHGKIESIQAGTGARFSLFPAENATGNFVKIVQRVPVKIVLDEQPAAELALAPGMSVEPVVHTAD